MNSIQQSNLNFLSMHTFFSVLITPSPLRLQLALEESSTNASVSGSRPCQVYLVRMCQVNLF